VGYVTTKAGTTVIAAATTIAAGQKAKRLVTAPDFRVPMRFFPLATLNAGSSNQHRTTIHNQHLPSAVGLAH
jgi:hypothetical protein